MKRAMQRLWREERGITLTELMITVTLLTLVTGAFLTFLESTNRAVVVEQERSLANDEARLAVQQLDREVRSANYIYDPDDEIQPYKGYSLRVYTQANAPTRTPGFQCVQWRIQDGDLLRRSWPTGQPGLASSWRLVAGNIVNVDLGQAAFKMDTDPDKGGRTVRVTLFVDVDLDDAVSRPVRLETSLTGRNVPSGYTASVCNPAPGG
jgi:type II secretory pathway pseudopilin PulG